MVTFTKQFGGLLHFISRASTVSQNLSSPTAIASGSNHITHLRRSHFESERRTKSQTFNSIDQENNGPAE